jgi:hypothetical protein
MEIKRMKTGRRSAIAVPFVMAFVLNLLSLVAYRFQWHQQRVAGYGFLFAVPWGWLIDALFVSIRSRWLSAVYGYTLILWLPATLYPVCLWLMLGGIQAFTIRLKMN